MKKRILGILTVMLALSMAFTMVSCGGDPGDEDPAVTGVTVTAAGGATSVAKGANLQFNAVVATKGNAAKTVTWTLDGYTGSDSSITDGLLSVGADESVTELTVKATSTFDTSKSGTAKVTVGPAASTTFTITYDANGWEGDDLPDPVTVSTGPIGAANLPSLEDTDDQIFIGWALTDDGDPIGAHYSVQSDITLYAIWEEVIPTGQPVTITYNANHWEGAGVPTTPGSGVSGDPIGAANLPVLEDTETQKFEGWATTSTGTPIDEDFVPTSNITLFVIWTQLGALEDQLTISFYLDEDGELWETIYIEPDTPIGPLPVPEDREGFVFNGWFSLANVGGGTNPYSASSRFSEDTNVYARWIPDVLTPDGAQELLYLTNGAAAVYQFDIPEGYTLNDYNEITIDYKISNAGLNVWKTAGARHVRLYGVYTSLTPVSRTGSDQSPQIVYYNLSGSDEKGNRLNNEYILDNGNDGNSIRGSVTANEWFTVTYDTTGTRGHANFNSANLQLAATGTVYYALGIGCQKIDEAGRGREGNTFIQLVKDVKLVPKSTAPEVAGTKPVDAPAQFLKPGYIPGQFLANNDPIVCEWRADPTQDNIDNWRDLVPERQAVVPFDRGDPPADAALKEVVLGDFTYINRGNPTYQLGWASFTEAGRANDQSYEGAPSVIAYDNFKKAWYLVVETEALPTGTVSLVWMGGAGGWNSKAITHTDGTITAQYPFTTITEKTGGGHIIKIFLPEALDNYQKYYEDNPDWAALAFSYWGGGDGNPRPGVTDLNITKAYLLVEDPAPDAKGLAAAFGFTLSNAPAGGDAIEGVVLNTAGTSLKITAAVGLTDCVWYVGGVKNTETSAGLTLAVKEGDSLIVSLQAKRDGKWVSQTVFITVGN